jgi:hypothetical protein
MNILCRAHLGGGDDHERRGDGGLAAAVPRVQSHHRLEDVAPGPGGAAHRTTGAERVTPDAEAALVHRDAVAGALARLQVNHHARCADAVVGTVGAVGQAGEGGADGHDAVRRHVLQELGEPVPLARGLHSVTFQLNLSAIFVGQGVFMGRLWGIHGGVGGKIRRLEDVLSIRKGSG